MLTCVTAVTVSFFSSAGLVSGNVHQRWYILFSGSASELSNTFSCEITQNVDAVLEMARKKCKQSTSELFPVESLSVMSEVHSCTVTQRSERSCYESECQRLPAKIVLKTFESDKKAGNNFNNVLQTYYSTSKHLIWKKHRQKIIQYLAVSNLF